MALFDPFKGKRAILKILELSFNSVNDGVAEYTFWCQYSLLRVMNQFYLKGLGQDIIIVLKW